MGKKLSNTGRVDTVFVLLIFCFFAVSVFLVLMLSASTYQNMNEISANGQNERIALSYIRTKVRNTDTQGALTVLNVDGTNVLSLRENIGDRNFATYLYHLDGWVYEAFIDADDELRLEEGIPMLRVGSLDFEDMEDGLVRIITCGGSMVIYARSSE
jgi:hypothetical protein